MARIRCGTVACPHNEDGHCANCIDKFAKYTELFSEQVLVLAKVNDNIYCDEKGRTIAVLPVPLEHMCGTDYLYTCFDLAKREAFKYVSHQLDILPENEVIFLGAYPAIAAILQ